MKAKFKVGDTVRPVGRGVSYWKGSFGDKYRIGKILTASSFANRRSYIVRAGKDRQQMFSYELEKVKER